MGVVSTLPLRISSALRTTKSVNVPTDIDANFITHYRGPLVSGMEIDFLLSFMILRYKDVSAKSMQESEPVRGRT